MHPLVRTIGIIANLTLNHSCQLYTALHILALNEFEDDITLRRFRVESLISLLIVLLHRNYRVLPHSHIKIILGTVHTERIGFKSTCYLTCRQSIGMHRDEKVCIGTISYIGTFYQRDKLICFTCINHPYLWHILLYISAEL